jgi:spore germination cell wall hydrolase CwlJ-like protein
VEWETLPLQEQTCLANVVWREARGEPRKGRRAVVDVVLWRAAKANASLCQVVRAPGQFSWVRRKGIVPTTQAMQAVLQDTLLHPQVITDPNVQYFFAGSTPSWMVNPRCLKIFNHSFCALRRTIHNA